MIIYKFQDPPKDLLYIKFILKKSALTIVFKIHYNADFIKVGQMSS